MQRESSVEQRGLLTAAVVEFFVIEEGVHGSSMLLDERTGHDVTAARSIASRWLRRIESGGG
ncbi:MAG TPA: hypothetical protein EYQ27_08905 [Gemmatimonadetes bacterium]|nr:hypothetical protein [Gemmatimonadota bacterium]